MNTKRVGSFCTCTRAVFFAFSDAGVVASTTRTMTATISKTKATITAMIRWSSDSSRSTSRFNAR
jgi:hypothetical protein